jgi:hypothetical protein
LLGIILHDVSHQDIGIQADHREAAPRLATAAFISSMETFFPALPNIPRNAVAGRLAAMSSYRPGATSTNSTRSPVPTCIALRTGAGMVICPFVVSVAVVMILTL